MNWSGRNILLVLFVFVASFKCKKTSADVTTVDIPSHPLTTDKDLDAILNEVGDARIVLLGEASHGTSEYYEWRAALSKRLILEKGFDFIGVEGEWADSYRVNQFIKGPKKDGAAAVNVLRHYDRWPTWMWGNHEVASLVTWLNNYNQGRNETGKVGFFGLDVYCLWESMEELIPYLQGNDSLLNRAQAVKKCFQPFSADASEYAYAVANSSANCREQTTQLWKSIMSMTGGATASNEAAFVMQQNALVAMNGEQYYRASVNSYPGSWNVRDQHMTQTIQRLLQLHGPQSKIIVWEHNTHIGDARFTDMAAGGMVNVGQLVRDSFGREKVYAVGFGSYSGTVIAANNWGGTMETMRVPPAQRGSWEELLYRSGATNKILLSSELRQNEAWMKPIGHRAIGVQYNPNAERGNYVPSVMPERYDAFVYIDKTTALRPIAITPRNEPPDTYPSGY